MADRNLSVVRLIGRQNEQAELNAALSSIKVGNGGLLLVAGEAGVGKTRLTEETLVHSGRHVLRAAARPARGGFSRNKAATTSCGVRG